MIDPVKALTRSALSAAAGTAILLLASVLPWGRLLLLFAAAVGVIFVRVSCSCAWALGCYAVTSLLGLILLPTKSPAILYAGFFGYYPLVKLFAERLGPNALRWAVKLAVFNLALAAFYGLARAVFTDVIGSVLMPIWLLWITANGAFVLYDLALTQLILYYLRTIAGRMK